MSSSAAAAPDEALGGPPPVCEVFVRATGSYGSGILIAPGLLMVAAHTLAEAERCEVRLHSGRSRRSWVGSRRIWHASGEDAALLAPEADDTFLPESSFTLVRFGVRPASAIDCRMIGFPAATDSVREGFNDSLDVEGRIHPGTFAGEGRLAVTVSSATPLDPRRWRGMSGAGILCGRTLLGVVLETAPEFGARMLKGLPVDRLFDDPVWRGLVSDGRGVDLEESIDAPGDLDGSAAVRLDPALSGCLERRLAACVAQNLPFRTYHKLKCVFDARSGFAQACFASVGEGVPAAIVDWLDRTILGQAQSDRGGPPAGDVLGSDRTFAAARLLAAAEGAMVADERHLLLALLEERETTTIAMLSNWLKPGGLERVAGSARSGRPRRFAASATPLPPPLPPPLSPSLPE